MMDLQLTGKRALITGSTRGIGHAIAQALAEEGAEVIVNGRDRAAVRDVRDYLDVLGAVADLSTAEGCEELGEVVARIGPLDILVHNLGHYDEKEWPEVNDAEWEHYLQTNLMSAIRLSRAFVPGMKERGWGRVIFIGAESALAPEPRSLPFSVTKTALLSFARGLAKWCAGSQVTVNTVLPGPTQTEGVDELAESLAKREFKPIAQVRREFEDWAKERTLAGRFAAPEEIAYFVAMLCSPRASYMTGATLRADGGIVDICF